MPTFQALQCYQCKAFVNQQKKKANKWKCPICSSKQSVMKIYGESERSKDIRQLITQMNAARAEDDYEEQTTESMNAGIPSEMANVASNESIDSVQASACHEHNEYVLQNPVRVRKRKNTMATDSQNDSGPMVKRRRFDHNHDNDKNVVLEEDINDANKDPESTEKVDASTAVEFDWDGIWAASGDGPDKQRMKDAKTDHDVQTETKVSRQYICETPTQNESKNIDECAGVFNQADSAEHRLRLATENASVPRSTKWDAFL